MKQKKKNIQVKKRARTINVPRGRVPYKRPPTISNQLPTTSNDDGSPIRKKRRKRRKTRKRKTPRKVVNGRVKTKYYDGGIPKSGFRKPNIYGYVFRVINQTYEKNKKNDQLGRSGNRIERAILSQLVKRL